LIQSAAIVFATLVAVPFGLVPVARVYALVQLCFVAPVSIYLVHVMLLGGTAGELALPLIRSVASGLIILTVGVIVRELAVGLTDLSVIAFVTIGAAIALLLYIRIAAWPIFVTVIRMRARAT